MTEDRISCLQRIQSVGVIWQLICLVSLLQISSGYAQTGIVVELDGKKQPFKQEMLINSGYHDIIFHLPKTDQTYYYKLDDLEKQWKNTSFPIVRYTNLPGGSYQFHAQLRNKGKTVAAYSFKVVIREDFWEKWWFFSFLGLMALVFISTIIYFWFLYDFRQKMKVEEIRQRIAADLHDEVGANLSSITFLTALLNKKLKKPEQDLELLLEKIARNSKESSALINDTIWALNPQYDSFEKLVEKIKSFAAEFLSTRDIALSVENHVNPQKVNLSLEQRRNIYLIFKEVINNIVKHAQASKVWIKIKMTGTDLTISIEDNGIGFDTALTYEGNGLKNYIHRSRNGETSVSTQSAAGSGTTITIGTRLKNHQN